MTRVAFGLLALSDSLLKRTTRLLVLHVTTG
jgi:hypothetical protein